MPFTILLHNPQVQKAVQRPSKQLHSVPSGRTKAPHQRIVRPRSRFYPPIKPNATQSPIPPAVPVPTATVARPKAYLKLPQSKPPVFSGAPLDYLPWRRLWKDTMGEGFSDPVQLAQLRDSLDKRAADIVGLPTIRSMAVFWSLMDEEYLDYTHFARLAIADIQSTSRTWSK